MDERREPHEQESEHWCRQGYEFLRQAELNQYQDKSLLKAANNAFMQSLACDRRNPHPYVGLGYLFLLVDDREKATTFLQQALVVDHLNKEAHRLLAYLEREGLPYAVLKHASNHDHLHDTLASSIVELVRLVMQQAPPEPTLDPQAFATLQANLTEESATYQRLQAQLAYVDQEINVCDLRQKLKPLEMHLKHLNNAIAASEQLQALSQQMAACRQPIAAVVQRLGGEHNPDLSAEVEPLIEHLMDQCDAVADQLDHLEESGISIQPLVKQYEQLVQTVENLQNRLED